MGAEPWPLLGIDPMVVGLAMLQATMSDIFEKKGVMAENS
jgi:hypothetical protein